jgi:hypothetical protein
MLGSPLSFWMFEKPMLTVTYQQPAVMNFALFASCLLESDLA